MTYIERKIDMLVAAAKEYCGAEAKDFDVRQKIALDILTCCGEAFLRSTPVTLKKLGELLSVFPLIKKDAVGEFKVKLQQMEDALLQIQVKIRSFDRRKKERGDDHA